MAATELGEGAALGEEGRWRLRSRVGAGGMATVWLAEDARLGRPVAVKILSATLAADPVYAERLVREARLAASLSHPNLVGVFDFSPGPPRPYLVMEYVPGGTLAERMRDGVALDLERVARELLRALAHVHAAGIVHRDVKPANVLIDTSGACRLTDFGIARPSEATALTSTGLVVGTKRYIAPEVLAGQPASARSDLYSLGILLRECLEGGGSAALRRLAGTLSAEAPEARPASAGEALRLLEAGTAPKRRTRLLEAGPAPKRRPRPLAAAAVLAAALVVLLIALNSGGGTLQPPPSGTRLVVPRPSAPLSSQLSALRSDVTRARP